MYIYENIISKTLARALGGCTHWRVIAGLILNEKNIYGTIYSCRKSRNLLYRGRLEFFWKKKYNIRQEEQI